MKIIENIEVSMQETSGRSLPDVFLAAGIPDVFLDLYSFPDAQGCTLGGGYDTIFS